jgi:predicted transcriptional regulator
MNIDPKILDSSELDKNLKYFLQTLASYADINGKCFPKQETIAKRMGVSARSVRYYLRQAVELRLVRVRRRWRRSNIYTMLCLVKAKLSTMRKPASEQNISTLNKNGSKQKTHQNIPKQEWKLCFEDAEQVLGKATAKKNKGWLSILIRKCGADLFMDSLRWVRSQMLEGEVSGDAVTCPGGLQWWYLQRQGVEV